MEVSGYGKPGSDIPLATPSPPPSALVGGGTGTRRRTPEHSEHAIAWAWAGTVSSGPNLNLSGTVQFLIGFSYFRYGLSAKEYCPCSSIDLERKMQIGMATWAESMILASGISPQLLGTDAGQQPTQRYC